MHACKDVNVTVTTESVTIVDMDNCDVCSNDMMMRMITPLVSLGWHGGLVVGRRTCDLRVAGSRPGRDAAAPQP